MQSEEMGRQDRLLSAGLFCLAVLLLSVVGGGAALAADEGRLSGKVIDEEGKPVGGIELLLAPADEGSASPIVIKVNRKGRFSVPRFPRGLRRLVVSAPPGLAVRHMTLDVRAPDGARMGMLDEDVPPGIEARPFAVGIRQRASVTLVVGKQEEEKAETVPIEAARTTSANLARLNKIFEAGDMERLLVESERILADDPDEAGAIYLRGIALWQLDRPEEAVKALRRSVALMPDQPGIHGTLGSVLAESARKKNDQGEEADARRLFLEAAQSLREQLEQTPGNNVYLVNLVIALEGAGEEQEATDVLKALVAADPGNIKARLRLVEILHTMGQTDQALEFLSQAPDSQEQVAFAYHNIAIDLFNAGEMEEVIAIMRRAVVLLPDHPMMHRLLGRALVAHGEIDEGVAELEKYLELDPDFPEADTDRALIEALGRN